MGIQLGLVVAPISMTPTCVLELMSGIVGTVIDTHDKCSMQQYKMTKYSTFGQQYVLHVTTYALLVEDK